MPTVSPAQERLMQAAAHTPGGYGGVPQSVGKEFIGKDAVMSAAGIAFVTADNELLLLRRSPTSTNPGTWCLPGGGVEEGETPEIAARREAFEEIGGLPHWNLVPIDQRTTNGVDFTMFAQVVEKFDPRLNDEHDDYQWAKLGNLPEGLLPALAATLVGEAELANDVALAFDRAMDGELRPHGLAFDRAAVTVREKTVDGNLKISVTPISKANVCPYRGSEIPDAELLGLDPDQVYKLLRDPAELEKAADTFNHLPLLDRHVAISAAAPKTEFVVGSTGTDCSFIGPYLMNSLVVWRKDAIDLIESNKKKELSSAYRYRADMTPGVHSDGSPYDGVMRDIVGNHVALVEEGRAGSDVVVGDLVNPSLQEMFKMSKARAVSRKAAYVQGALAVYLQPKLAMDAKIDIGKAVRSLTNDNFKAKMGTLAAWITEATAGKLAKDAKLDDLSSVLLALDEAKVEEPKAADEFPDKDDDDKKAEDEDEDDEDEMADDEDDEYAGMSDADKQKAIDKKAKDKKAKDKKARDKKAKDEAAEEEAEEGRKKAMDQAIKVAVKLATDEAIKGERAKQQGIFEAREKVRPLVGDLPGLAFDSAAAVYQHTIKSVSGNDVSTVTDVTALQTMVGLLPKPGQPSGASPYLGMDLAATKSFEDRFPGTKSVTIG